MRVVTGSACPGFEPMKTVKDPESFDAFLDARRREVERLREWRSDGTLTAHQIEKLDKGRPFKQVQTTVGNRPTVVIFGGKEEEDHDPGFVLLMDQLSLYLALVGASWVQGMGPGNMEFAAKSASQARQRVAKLPYVCHWKSVIAGVPLDVRGEPLHNFADPDCITIQIRELKDRVDGLLQLGYPMLCLHTRGGTCTVQEVQAVQVYKKNRLELPSTFGHLYPEECFVDNDEKFWEPWFELQFNMVRGTPERVARKTREFEEYISNWTNYDPKPGQTWQEAAINSAKFAFERFCLATARTYMAPLDQVFEFDNGISVYEAAELLVASEADSSTVPFRCTA